MGYSEYDPANRERRAWNARKMVRAKRTLKPQSTVRYLGVDVEDTLTLAERTDV
jgi:hypothetical protein